MLKIGIVAEYNPFHNGHLYQIRKIREIFGKDVFIAVVGSGDFVQRGEISFLDKWEKTQVNFHFTIRFKMLRFFQRWRHEFWIIWEWIFRFLEQRRKILRFCKRCLICRKGRITRTNLWDI